MHMIMIDLEKCTGCKRCYKACYVDVIRWDEKSQKPYVKYPEECATCNCCEIACPVGAVRVAPGNPAPYPVAYPKRVYPFSYERF